MTPELRGWVDEDRPHLNGLTDAKRIDWFQKRLELVTLKPLAHILHDHIQTTEYGSALLIWGASVCAAIEACGKFIAGYLPPPAAPQTLPQNSIRFARFLKDYMHPDFQQGSIVIRTEPTQRNGTYGDALWAHFRNGIAHGFAVCHGGFEGSHADPYFVEREIAGHNCLLVNPEHFFSDFTHGAAKYLQTLRRAQHGDAVLTNFLDIFQAVYIDGK